MGYPADLVGVTSRLPVTRPATTAASRTPTDKRPLVTNTDSVSVSAIFANYPFR